MAGRGGARNVRPTGVSVMANVLGIQRGELGASSISQPPPLFPPQDAKPLPLSCNDDHTYMALVKNEFSNRMRESAYFLRDREPKKDIDRYSDKFRKVIVEPWTPYYDRIPKELWPKNMIDAKCSPVTFSKRRKVDEKGAAAMDLAKKLETLERREVERQHSSIEEEKEASKKNADDDEEEEGAEPKDDEQEMSDEDYQEEDNDYIQNYFDNGESYLDESEENLDDEAFY